MTRPLPLLNPFVGREHEQGIYRQVLAHDTPWVFVVTGQGGIGKSALLRHLKEQTPREMPVVLLNFANDRLRIDVLNILEELSGQLAPDCDERRSNAFEQALADGRDKLARLAQQMSQNVIVGDAASLQGATLSMGGYSAEALREQRRQVREMVTSAFYHQLSTFRPARLVLMLDTCEWLSEGEGLEAGKWVMDELLPGVHERLGRARPRRNCSAVIAGRVQPPLTVIEKQERYPQALPMLDQPAVEGYLEQVGMHDAALRQRAYDITRGHALCVSIIGALWQEQGDRPFTLADLPRLQAQFTEKALIEYIQDRLDKRLVSPYRELTRYGVLLRSFNLPMLRAVFPELLPDEQALDIFRQLVRYPYVEPRGNQHYAFHDLQREIQAAEIREQQRDKWQLYHKRALDYLSQQASRSPDRYYHAVAYDEEEGMLEWWDVVQNARNFGTLEECSTFLQVLYDGTLQLTAIARGKRAFQHGQYYQRQTQMNEALRYYEEALPLFLQAKDRLGEANVRRAMGDVQQFRKEMEAALASYEQALGFYRQVGDRLGEANCYLAQGRVALQQEDYQKALDLHNNAYQLYYQIQDKYSQARLLYYRSFVYGAMDDMPHALSDAEQALAIGRALDLSFVDVFQARVDELRVPS
jgi:tetratricopeptide (TPR) repeat protein